ncbi:hypothetical protein AC579_8529 [Pseudocercospora musae]|uniref:Uncharacterized protein n=1 Tax=Pseudocercospora musae TaxID=113226 RepID=A0A139I1Z9_9PEZI|nr:hypothetical protein AC579_8529 [Pseudocercospora musae]
MKITCESMRDGNVGEMACPPTTNNNLPTSSTTNPTPRRQSTLTTMHNPTTASSHAYRTALQYVKALFGQEQYRKCIQVCRDALKMAARGIQVPLPLHRTYISLYLALSYDAIARVMHHNSVAKLPAFDSAEQHFYEALAALPSSQDARELCTRLAYERRRDPFLEEARKRYSMYSQLPPSHPYHRTPSRTSSLWLSSPPQLGGEHIPSSPAHTASELDDIESHASLDLATPKGLPREPSRMSLFDSSPLEKRASVAPMTSLSLQRQKSVRGPMRPIRSPSPAKAFHIPPTRPSSESDSRRRSILPRLSTAEQTSSRPASSYLAYASMQSEHIRSPVSPVSPISWADSDGHSDDTPVSPISPHTPQPPAPPPVYHEPAYNEPIPSTCVIQEAPDGGLDEAALLRFTDHINAMRCQIEAHLTMLYNSKDQLYQLQKEKKAAAEARMGAAMPESARDSGKYFLSSPAPSRDRSPEAKSIPQSSSYWSFVPEDVKVDEKKARIEAGRERKWARKRFDPTRYQELAEKALAEL